MTDPHLAQHQTIESRDVSPKSAVRDFWSEAPCGDVYAVGETEMSRLEANARARYRLEPYIAPFARFSEGRNQKVLEIGVGMGADHLEWARAQPAILVGIDLTHRGVEITRRRLTLDGLDPQLIVGDAENIACPESFFDIVYSFGVLHHSPDTARAFREIHRVLRRGGVARIMVYHSHSITGYMLWFRYALARGRPWMSLRDVYARFLESPGTKAYTPEEVRTMCSSFSSVHCTIQLSFGDLLQGEVGQRHRGPLLAAAKRLWPRWLMRRLFKNYGLFLFVEVVK